jgi:cytochrome c-type biogenesis protein CcmH/NrfG
MHKPINKPSTLAEKMTQSNNGILATVFDKHRVLSAALIFLLGFVAGVAFTVYKSSSLPKITAETATQGPPHDEELHQAIIKLEAEIAAKPDDYQGWTRLGNLYFDTDQPKKAIAAYEKSLALNPDDANVLTDLGVMYRKIKEPRQAIAHFEKAMEKDPQHLPSRYNKGIVLIGDLGDPQGGIASWETMLKIDPQATNGSGMAISELIEKVRQEAAKKK